MGACAAFNHTLLVSASPVWNRVICISKTSPCKFFFVSGLRWEYPKGEHDLQKFSIQAIWSYVPLAKSLGVDLSRREEARLVTVLSWVTTHYDTKIDDVLSDVNIEDFLTTTDRSYVFGREFLLDLPSP